MRLLGSLRSRVFATTALVAVLPMAAALLFVTRRVGAQAQSELRRSLDEAVRLVAQYHRTRLELAAERAMLIADLPRLKSAVDTADAGTVEPVARDYRERVRSDVFVVTDRAGRTLVAIGTRSAPWPPGGDMFRVDGGRLLETVNVPIVIGAAPAEMLGRLTLGFALDSAFAARLRALTGSEVAIVRGDRVFASTLSRTADRELAAHASRSSGWLDLGGEEYGTARAVLGPDPQGPVVLVLRSRAEALRPLGTLRSAVAAAAFGAIAVSLLLSWAVARTVTRPLAALTDEMKQIAATGDLAPQDRAAAAVGRRGREAALARVRLADGLDRALPAAGRAARPAVRAGAPVDRDRPRGAQPADGDQGLAAVAEERRRLGGRGAARPPRTSSRRWRASTAWWATCSTSRGRCGSSPRRSTSRRWRGTPRAPRWRGRTASSPRLALDPATGSVVSGRRSGCGRCS